MARGRLTGGLLLSGRKTWIATKSIASVSPSLLSSFPIAVGHSLTTSLAQHDDTLAAQHAVLTLLDLHDRGESPLGVGRPHPFRRDEGVPLEPELLDPPLGIPGPPHARVDMGGVPRAGIRRRLDRPEL